MALAQTHSNYSYDWWTPEPWYRWARETLGGAVFDPCRRDYDGSEERDMLKQSWANPHNNLYVNHPGGRGNAQKWWMRAVREWGMDIVWAAFNIEQLRILKPSPLEFTGYLILPKKRLRWVWGGPTGWFKKGELVPEGTKKAVHREHGQPCKSPSHWAVFWSTVIPTEPPEPCWIRRTGPATLVDISREPRNSNLPTVQSRQLDLFDTQPWLSSIPANDQSQDPSTAHRSSQSKSKP